MLKNPKIGQKIYYISIPDNKLFEHEIIGIYDEYFEIYSLGMTSSQRLDSHFFYNDCPENQAILNKLRELFNLIVSSQNQVRNLWIASFSPNNNEISEEI